MSAAKEELKLVESFDELRAGMIVVVRPCNSCGESHRGLLGNPMDSQYGLAYPHWPQPDCWYPFDKWPSKMVSAHAVRSQMVYRVIDGLESETTTERKKVRVKP